MATQIIQGKDGHCFLAMKREISQLYYDLSCSSMLSWTSKGHNYVSYDSDLSMAITECGLIEGPNARVTHWEKEDEKEEVSAIRTAFKSQAGKTKENGVFIFTYSGPGLSGETMKSWLEELDTALPKRIVMFLDYHSADDTAKLLTTPQTVTTVETLCIFSSCFPSCPLQLASTLEVPLFSYLTSLGIRKYTPAVKNTSQQILYLSQINGLVKECWMAIASLCLSEKDNSGPSVASITVRSLSSLMQTQTLGGEGMEETNGAEDLTDSVLSTSRFGFIEMHFQVRKKVEDIKLCEVAYRWLDYLKHGDTSPLHMLNRHTLLSNKNIFLFVLQLLVHSLVLIQEANDPRNTTEPNTLIVVYIQAVSVLEMISPATAPLADVNQFQSAAEAYCLTLELKGLSTARVNDLVKKVKKE